MGHLVVAVDDFIPDIVDILGERDLKKVFPNMLHALNVVAALYRLKWVGYASGEPIPGTSRVVNSSGEYKQSIKVDDVSETHKEVYTDSPVHPFIELGHGTIDLKPGLLTGPKARIGKEGTAYNVVSFRHGVPGSRRDAMPVSIYNLMKQEIKQSGLGTSKVIGTANGRQVNKLTEAGPMQSNLNQYSWGARLGKTQNLRGSKDKHYAGRQSIYAGMVKMDTSTAKAKRSSYITFRTVSVKSPPHTWIVPPLEGTHIVEAVAGSVRKDAEEIITMALMKDLAVQ